MRHHYTADVIHKYSMTMTTSLCNSITKGSNKETTNATLVLGAFVITILDSVSVSDDQYVQLVTCVKNRLAQDKYATGNDDIDEDDNNAYGQVVERRCALMYVLGLLYFVREANQDLMRDKDGIVDSFVAAHWNEKQPLVLVCAHFIN